MNVEMIVSPEIYDELSRDGWARLSAFKGALREHLPKGTNITVRVGVLDSGQSTTLSPVRLPGAKESRPG